MRKQRRALAEATAGWLHDVINIDRDSLLELTTKLKLFGTAVILPIIAFVFFIRITWDVTNQIKRFFFPPTPYQRHIQARSLYRKGRIDDACNEWNELLSVKRGIFFGPSAMSLACHEIYINHNYQKGMFMLKQAKQRQQQFLASNSGNLPSKKKGVTSARENIHFATETTRDTRKRLFLRMNPKKLDEMMLDAEAYLHGDGVMVERMNAPQAKLEHLGISTSDETMDNATNTKDGPLRRRLWK